MEHASPLKHVKCEKNAKCVTHVMISIRGVNFIGAHVGIQFESLFFSLFEFLANYPINRVITPLYFNIEFG